MDCMQSKVQLLAHHLLEMKHQMVWFVYPFLLGTAVCWSQEHKDLELELQQTEFDWGVFELG